MMVSPSKINEGDRIIIRLEENSSTRYLWAVDVKEGDSVEIQDSNSSVSTDTGFGADGLRTITFTAKKPGLTQIKLKQWREWEGDDSVIDRYNVTINVLKN